MKKIVQLIGLICFILFSFFYTDKVMTVIREEDKIMIELKNIQKLLNIEAIDAKITDDTIIPGINGKKVNIEKSYKNMKKKGIFNQDEIIYDTVKPKISMNDNKDKYITLGNTSNQMISILLILNNDKYLEKVQNILNKKDIISNYFINYNYLISNTTKIKELNNCEIYSYGENGTYTPDNLLFSNNLISRLSNNEANICLVTEKEKNTLNLCDKNNLYTIIPNIIITKNSYEKVKNSLTSGSMILFYLNQDTLNNLEIILNHIQSKGYKIVGLSQILNENIS